MNKETAAMRKLGYWESLCAWAHDTFDATGLMFTRIRIKGVISNDALVNCLELMFLRHPLLRATLHHTSEYYYFKLNGQFSNIEVQTIDHIKMIPFFIEQSLKQPLMMDRSLWRVALFTGEKRSELIIFFHHSIADGISSIYFTNELLHSLSLPQSTSPKTITSLPFLGSIEKMINPYLSNPKMSMKKGTLLTPIYYEKQEHLHKRCTKNIFKVISKKSLHKIIVFSKNHVISMNSFFNAILFISMQHVLRRKLAIEVITPLNLRHYAKPAIGEQHIGCYITCLAVPLESMQTDEDIALIAQQYQTNFKNLLATLSTLPEELQLNKRTSESGSFLDANAENYFSGGIAVTNKGTSNLSKYYGALELTGYFTASSRQAGDLAINLSLTTVHDKVYCCFTYTKPLFSTQRANNLVKHFFGLIDSI